VKWKVGYRGVTIVIELVKQYILKGHIQLSKAILTSPLVNLTKDRQFHHPFTDYIASDIHLLSFDLLSEPRGQLSTCTPLVPRPVLRVWYDECRSTASVF